jgi:hypothetical protein
MKFIRHTVPLLAFALLACGEKAPKDDTAPPEDTDTTGLTDADGDGYASEAEGGDDCEDGDPDINPGAAEICDDGIDNDCSGGDMACLERRLAGADAIIRGSANTTKFGYELAAAGDINGDGVADVIVGDISHRRSTYDKPGAVRAFFGPIGGELQASDADITVVGQYDGDGLGAELRAGEVDGDGLPDLLAVAAGEDSADAPEGTAYLILGSTLQAGDVDVRDAAATFYGLESSAAYGRGIDIRGDVDGDGQDDLLLGASDADAGATFHEYGAVYVYPGTTRGYHLASEADTMLYGLDGEETGHSVANAGDVDGDGIGDVIIGAYDMHPDGGAYFMAGPLQGNIDLNRDGVRLEGTETYGRGAGASVTGGRDVDGDGLDDVAIGAARHSVELDNGGAVFIYTTVPTSGSLEGADAVLLGNVEEGKAGWSTDMQGDADGDGRADLLTSGYHMMGDVWLALAPFEGTLSLEHAHMHATGEEAGNRTGWVSSFVGDMDQDGHDDFMVGAYEADDETGAAYLMLGGGLF